MNRVLMLATAAAMALSACTTVPQSTANETASAPSPAPVAGEAFERDRQAILAMVGNFDVRFDFIETVALAEGYELKDRKLSGAYEVVRVVEDTGDFISLQHTLVIGEGDDAFPLKHWRQDWTYEPEKVLSFIGGNAWTVTDVPADERRGAWSQEVYQVDDSPRYGGVGRWTYEDGVPTWEAKRAWRPLPRRDMTTRDDYHAVDAVNRHAITPDGWVHEQDNTKVVLTTGEAEALVREVAVNTYKRSDAFDASIVDKRLAKTQDYWEGVKAAWEAFETAGEPFALTLKGEPEALYQPLLALGSEVADGERSTESAISEAREIIGTYTTLDLPPLTERLR